jgi:hypothetical protein
MKCKISGQHRHKITVALAKEIRKLEMLADANDAELCRLMLNGAFEALRDDLELYLGDDIEAIMLEEQAGFGDIEIRSGNRNIH